MVATVGLILDMQQLECEDNLISMIVSVAPGSHTDLFELTQDQYHNQPISNTVHMQISTR